MAVIKLGKRIGRIKQRMQSFNPRINRWVKSDMVSGKFLDVKADTLPFKDVRRNKPNTK